MFSPDVSHLVSLIIKEEVQHLLGLFGSWSEHIMHLGILL